MKIILHLGHGKTGSSYIQSALALSQDRLRDCGIDYPDYFTFDKAREGRITSGNIISNDTWPDYLCARIDESKSDTILFSNEHLFSKVRGTPRVLEELGEQHSLRFIVFIRNPLDHMFSVYNQGVKRGGWTTSIDKFSEEYQVPVQVLRFLKVVEAAPAELSLLNYSNHQDHILESFTKALAPDSDLQLEEPPHPIVNRSLTLAEMALQREFNRS